MFKKPGVRIGCPRDMGNASERMDGSERYDDGGDPWGRLGMGWSKLPIGNINASSHYAAPCSGHPGPPLKDLSVVEPPAPEPSLEPGPPGSDPAPAAPLLPDRGVVKGRVSGEKRRRALRRAQGRPRG